MYKYKVHVSVTSLQNLPTTTTAYNHFIEQQQLEEARMLELELTTTTRALHTYM